MEGQENSRLYNEMVLLRACLHGGGDPTNFEAMRAKVASSSSREQCVHAHVVSGELAPKDEVHDNEPYSNGVSKDDYD